MSRFGSSFPLSGVLALAVMALSVSAAHATSATDARLAQRDLWVEHVFWIRNYVVATNAHDPQLATVAEQEVVANAKALAATIAPFYGQAASDRLLGLLAGHWEAVRGYHKASLAKSASERDKSVANIVGNAREIAKFLASANPYLPEDAVFGLLSSHGGHHITQIDQLAARDFRAEAGTWQAMRHHMLVMADAIADALAKQFPQRLKETS